MRDGVKPIGDWRNSMVCDGGAKKQINSDGSRRECLLGLRVTEKEGMING